MTTKQMKMIVSGVIIMPIIIIIYLIFFAKNTSVNWNDFIRFGNTNYENTYIIVDYKHIGEELGVILETAPSRINQIHFRMKNGQAGTLPKGTKYYQINGYEPRGYLGVCIDEIYYLYKAYDYVIPASLVENFKSIYY